jgi:type VI protein secretion system component VasK
LINIGSKFWHRAWEKKIEKLDPNEQVSFRYPLNEEKFPWEIRFSPSKIIILLSLITWAGWFVLIIWNYHQFGCCRWWWVLVSVVTTVLAVLLPWLSTRHEEPKASSA